MIRLLPILCVLAFIPVNASASVDANGAQTVKELVHNMLDYQKKTGEAFGSVEVIYEGDIQVEQKVDYYAVTFPRILLGPSDDLKGGATDVKDFVVDLGVITMNIAPDNSNLGYWKSIIQFADSISVTENGAKIFEIKAEEQSTVALLSEKLGYFTKLNMNFSKLSFVGTNNDSGFSLEGFQFFQNLDEVEDEAFSGPYAVAFKNMRIAPPNEDETMIVEEFRVSGDLLEIKLPTLQEYQVKVLNFIEAMNTLEIEQDAEQSMKDEEVFNALMDMYDFDWDGLSAEYSVKNFQFLSSDGTEGVVLDNASFGMGVTGLRSDTGSINLGIDYDGLEMMGVDYDEANVYAPKSLNFDIQLDQVPYASLNEMANTSVKSIIDNPESAQMIGMGLMLRVPSLLTQSGTKAKVNGLAVNDDYNLNVVGDAVADLKAVMGFTAKFKTVFEGLDALLSKVKGSESITDADDIVQEIEEFKSKGVQETGPNGKPAYAYTFEVTPEGQMLLNGEDAATVLPQ